MCISTPPKLGTKKSDTNAILSLTKGVFDACLNSSGSKLKCLGCLAVLFESILSNYSELDKSCWGVLVNEF